MPSGLNVTSVGSTPPMNCWLLVGLNEAPSLPMRVGLDAAARDAALEVRDEEMPGVRGRETGAGVIREARRSVLDVADRRQNIRGTSGEARFPQPFADPRTTLAARRVLVTHAPAAVAAFDDVHEAFHVALVAVVVAREEIAVFVEHQLLRIAQAAVHELEARCRRGWRDTPRPHPAGSRCGRPFLSRSCRGRRSKNTSCRRGRARDRGSHGP